MKLKANQETQHVVTVVLSPKKKMSLEIVLQQRPLLKSMQKGVVLNLRGIRAARKTIFQEIVQLQLQFHYYLTRCSRM